MAKQDLPRIINELIKHMSSNDMISIGLVSVEEKNLELMLNVFVPNEKVCTLWIREDNLICYYQGRMNTFAIITEGSYEISNEKVHNDTRDVLLEAMQLI